jgi:hypothetical protein
MEFVEFYNESAVKRLGRHHLFNASSTMRLLTLSCFNMQRFRVVYTVIALLFMRKRFCMLMTGSERNESIYLPYNIQIY